MKGKIFLFIYCILCGIFIYSRVFEDIEVYNVVKDFLIVPLIFYYIVSVKKINYKFLLVLMLYLLGDILFTLDPNYQAFGFDAYFLANVTLSLLILNKMKFINTKVILIIIFLLTTLLLYFSFNVNEVFQKVLLWAFYISIGLVFVLAYIRHLRVTKLFTLWMLLSTLLFVFCNFLANINYFILNNITFRSLSSVLYAVFIFGITKSMVIEAKEEKSLQSN